MISNPMSSLEGQDIKPKAPPAAEKSKSKSSVISLDDLKSVKLKAVDTGTAIVQFYLKSMTYTAHP
jgi:hypothetical protein